MSLLNQMLKDLEQRNAGAAGAKPLSDVVRSVASPSPANQPIWLWAAVVLLALLASAFGIAWYKSTPRHTVQAVQLPTSPNPVVVNSQPAPPVVEMTPQVPVAQQQTSKAVVVESPAAAKPAAASPAEEKLVEMSQDKPQSPVAVPAVSRDKAAPKPAVAAPIKQVSPQQRSDNLYRQAVGLLQQGRVAEAQGLLEQSLEHNPLNHNARQLLAGLLLDNKRSAEATALLQEGVKLAPDQSGFVMALARLQVESGNADAGLQTMQNGLQYAASEGEYQGFYAALLQRAEQHDAAVTHYLAALRTDPANASWLIGVGISLQALAKFSDARDAFERARQVGKLSPDLMRFVEQRLAQLARQAK